MIELLAVFLIFFLPQLYAFLTDKSALVRMVLATLGILIVFATAMFFERDINIPGLGAYNSYSVFINGVTGADLTGPIFVGGFIWIVAALAFSQPEPPAARYWASLVNLALLEKLTRPIWLTWALGRPWNSRLELDSFGAAAVLGTVLIDIVLAVSVMILFGITLLALHRKYINR